LEGKTATTYPTTKQTLESFGVTVVEKPFVPPQTAAQTVGSAEQTRPAERRRRRELTLGAERRQECDLPA
jgi:hypothetical protein